MLYEFFVIVLFVRERLTVGVISAWQGALAKQEEGRKQLKRVFLCALEEETFTTHTAEKTPAGGTFFVLPKMPVRVEQLAGDLSYAVAVDRGDCLLLENVGLFASLRNGELDAYTLSEKLVQDVSKFVRVMKHCTRGCCCCCFVLFCFFFSCRN